MYKIRIVETGSGASAVQVIRYQNRKRIVVKHIGSARNAEELLTLKQLAQKVIEEVSRQIDLFEDQKPANILYLEQSEFLGVYYLFLYEALRSICRQIGFNPIVSQLLLDLVIIRIVEPASKQRSVELLEEYFGIRHRRQSYYKSVDKWIGLKSDIEAAVTTFAQNEYFFDYSLLFYDVTTLYFETFKEDELRNPGFSKDNKSQQPQVVVALMVTREGFPIAYEVFKGSTFEGHTIIPFVESFVRKHQVKHFTVVADAAMISADNIKALVKSNIHYIVGARLGNLSASIIDQIDKELPRKDGSLLRFKTNNGCLICGFSTLRYRRISMRCKNKLKRQKWLLHNRQKTKNSSSQKAKTKS